MCEVGVWLECGVRPCCVWQVFDRWTEDVHTPVGRDSGAFVDFVVVLPPAPEDDPQKRYSCAWKAYELVTAKYVCS